MCKYFDILKVLCIISAIVNISSQNKDDYIISLESEEITHINKVDDSASKEDFEQLDRRKEVQKEKEQRVEYEDKAIFLKKEEDVGSLEPKSTVKPRRKNLSRAVNLTSYNCLDKKESSSEECKSTLVSYPFSVSIQRRGAHFASGALIDRQHVLTAAQEFFNVREIIKLFRVRLGSVDCKKGGVTLPIKLVEIHPNFVNGQPSFDLALLTLSKAVQTTGYIKPIPLSTVQEGVLSAKFLTTYWPRLIVNGELLPKTAKERLKHHNMRVSTQKLIPWKTCASLMKVRAAELDRTSLCLKPITAHHSICSPDVGAPVVADDGLWGITSGWTSEQCTKYPSPTIITRTNIAPVRSWVKSVIEANGGRFSRLSQLVID